MHADLANILLFYEQAFAVCLRGGDRDVIDQRVFLLPAEIMCFFAKEPKRHARMHTHMYKNTRTKYIQVLLKFKSL